MPARGVKLAALVGLAAGVGAVIGLLLLAHPGRIWSLIVEASWWLAVVAVIHLGYILLTTFAWNGMLAAQHMRMPLRDAYLMRWIADAVNALVPFMIAQGEVLRGRLQVERFGADGPRVSAVIVVELTARMTSLVLFIAVGIVLMALTSHGKDWAVAIGAGAGLVAMLVAYYVVQRKGGIDRLGRKLHEHSGSKLWQEIGADAEQVSDLLPEIYEKKAALFRAMALHFAAWMVGGFEIYLLLRAIGHAVSPLAAWTVEGIGQAARNAGFFLPAALGAQEGGYALGTMAIGIGSAIGVAIAIMKRVRDVIVGAPALILWQWSAFRERLGAS